MSTDPRRERPRTPEEEEERAAMEMLVYGLILAAGLFVALLLATI